MNSINVVKRHALSTVTAAQNLARKAGDSAGRLLVVGAAGLAATSGANAATTVDVSAVVTAISDGVTVVSSIWVAVLSLVVVIKIFKWVQRAI